MMYFMALENHPRPNEGWWDSVMCEECMQNPEFMKEIISAAMRTRELQRDYHANRLQAPGRLGGIRYLPVCPDPTTWLEIPENQYAECIFCYQEQMGEPEYDEDDYDPDYGYDDPY